MIAFPPIDFNSGKWYSLILEYNSKLPVTSSSAGNSTAFTLELAQLREIPVNFTDITDFNAPSVQAKITDIQFSHFPETF